MTNQKKDNNFILRGQTFESLLADYLETKNGRLLSLGLNKVIARSSDLEQSYRVINHWDKEGLLLSYSDKNTEDKKHLWRSFSGVDIAWLGVLQELRNFGLDLEKLKIVKSSIINKKVIKTNEKLLFEFYVACAVGRGLDVSVIVFSDGRAEIGFFEEIEASVAVKSSPSNYLKISLLPIVERLKKKELQKTDYSSSNFSLSKGEVLLLGNLRSRSENLLDINVKTKAGLVKRIEIKKNVLLKKGESLSSVLKKQTKLLENQKIILDQKDGKTVGFQVIEYVRFET